jgi:hypothetical protein
MIAKKDRRIGGIYFNADDYIVKVIKEVNNKGVLYTDYVWPSRLMNSVETWEDLRMFNKKVYELPRPVQYDLIKAIWQDS